MDEQDSHPKEDTGPVGTTTGLIGPEALSSVEPVDAERVAAEPVDAEPVGPQPVGVPELARPGDALRSLPAEARERGTRLVSARAMQARLFSVYDAAAAAEDALSLVQEQLTLTLNRSYYDADEIERMAERLDALLRTDRPGIADAGPPAGQ